MKYEKPEAVTRTARIEITNDNYYSHEEMSSFACGIKRFFDLVGKGGETMRVKVRSV